MRASLRQGARNRRLHPDDPNDIYTPLMLFIALILFGMLIGAGAQLILGGGRTSIDWSMAIIAGLVGSFIGGLLISLLSGDGLELRPSGIIGSIVGAVIVTALWRFAQQRRNA